MKSLSKDVPLHLNAARRIAKSSPPQGKSPNAKSSAVKVTCAMELKYQRSALSCYIGMCYRRFCSLKFEIKSLNVALCRKTCKMHVLNGHVIFLQCSGFFFLKAVFNFQSILITNRFTCISRVFI